MIQEIEHLPQYQFINENRIWGKGVRFIIPWTKRKTGKVTPSKLCHPTFERKCLLFNGESKDSVWVRDGMYVAE
jgi:hypothetical protein